MVWWSSEGGGGKGRAERTSCGRAEPALLPLLDSDGYASWLDLYPPPYLSSSPRTPTHIHIRTHTHTKVWPDHFPLIMAFVALSGFPSSGKTTVVDKLVLDFQARMAQESYAGPQLEIVIIRDDLGPEGRDTYLGESLSSSHPSSLRYVQASEFLTALTRVSF